jgi:hypothetical protein
VYSSLLYFMVFELTFGLLLYFLIGIEINYFTTLFGLCWREVCNEIDVHLLRNTCCVDEDKCFTKEDKCCVQAFGFPGMSCSCAENKRWHKDCMDME